MLVGYMREEDERVVASMRLRGMYAIVLCVVAETGKVWA